MSACVSTWRQVLGDHVAHEAEAFRRGDVPAAGERLQLGRIAVRPDGAVTANTGQVDQVFRIKPPTP